ncbi:unnamed protein product [Camellia sinensis]
MIGPVLESIVTRTVKQIETTKEHTRLVGLSATLPNYEDVALFLRVDLNKGLFHFDNSYRPCPLAQQFIGVMVKNPLQRLQLMNDICYEKVVSVAGKHQVLVFVHSRKETAKTAHSIRDTALANGSLGRFLKEDSGSREILKSHTELVKSNDLKDLLPYGFAIHHARMVRADRELVETLFTCGCLDVQEGLSMILIGKLPIESQLMPRLADQLNAEIVLGTIQNAREACNWLTYTYFYVRMLKNPTLYGVDSDDLIRDVVLEKRRADLIYSTATILHRNCLVKYDKKSGNFQVTDLGRIASYYYITHGTISTYNEHLKPTMGHIKLYQLFSLSQEFKYVTVRQDEKMELAKLVDHVPIPIMKSLEEPSAKINVLLQAYISRLKLEGLSLTSDMFFITQSAGRLMRALFEIVLKRGWAQVAKKALNLCKMVSKRMWSVQTPLRQFHGIPKEILMRLENKDIAWERYYDLSSHELGELIRLPKMGRTLHKFIHQFPKLNLAAHVQPITRTVLRVELRITLDFLWEDTVHEFVEPFWVIVEDNDREFILHHEYFMLKKQYIDEDHVLDFTVPICAPLPPQYFIRIVSDRWFAVEFILFVPFRQLILPGKYPPQTELLDLQPFPTQVFNVLYNTDDNVLVVAPTGSGKTICAEFAILRNHQKGPESVMRVVYIAHFEALAREHFNNWNKKFGDGLGMRVTELTGETTKDLKLLEEGQLVITTPEKWDALSRSWKQRKHVQQSLSTSFANGKDLGEWIGATSHGLFNFSPNARPVPLELCIQGIDIANFEARMQAMMKPTYTAIVQHVKHGKPAIVFVPTRKHAQLITVDLMTYSGKKAQFVQQSAEKLEPFILKIKEPMLRETLQHGVGYLHKDLTSTDQEIVKTLFETRCIQVCVLSSSMCWGVPMSAHLVVVMGTQYDDGHENAPTDYPVTDLLQMMGRANRSLVDNSGKCVIFCHSPHKEYYRKFLYEALPVESHLHHFLCDNLNAEVIVGTIKNKQDAVDYLTWTFMYKRLTQNPNYYNLQGLSHGHLSDHLSELVENTLNDFEASKFVTIEEDFKITHSNLGRIASYYYISHITIECFSSSLTSNTKLKGILEILASASEYAQLPIRPGEEELIRRLINHQRFSFENPKCTDPHVKANALLLAHFSRQVVGGKLFSDQREVLISAIHNGWLRLSLLAMEVSQLVTWGMWELDSMLLQLPHFTKDLAKKCQKNPGRSIESVFDLMEMEDNERRGLLKMSDSQLMDIARFCNCYPNVDLMYDALDSDNVRVEEDVSLQFTLQRDIEGQTEVGHIDAPRYPKAKEEGWWLIVGDTKTSQLLVIRKVSFRRKSNVELVFIAPGEAEQKTYTLYFVCDSYVGCDQEYSFSVDVKEALAHEDASVEE